jgi:hypothetical protein
MRFELFDRGGTLEGKGVLLPGALELLKAVQAMRDSQGDHVPMGVLPTSASRPTLRRSPSFERRIAPG